MNFENSILLTSEEIEQLVTSMFPNDKANTIAKGLCNYCFINKGMIYFLESNITYSHLPLTVGKSKLVTIITSYIQKSFQSLSKSKQKKLKSKYDKFYKIFLNADVSQYYDQIITVLEGKKIVFDTTPYEIHFNNGYYDLQHNKFKQRELHKHYVTQYIQRDYVKSSEDERDKMMEHIRKIYPDNEDMNCILLTLGSALSGKSNVDQDTLFLLGVASAGKSFIMELSQKTFECYFKELKNDTFSHNNSKIDKILNSFANNPQIRITWVNEIKDVKIDETLFKKFCEGKLQTTKLYEDESHDITHNSKSFITANTMPSMKIDSGVVRRFKGYTHVSKFVDNPDEVDESNHIYLKDKYLLDNIVKHNLLNAWFDILAKYCYKWSKGEKPKFNKNFTETKDSVVNTNDIMQDFIDGYFIKTDKSSDRISKEQMETYFKKQYPDKHLSMVQLITSLKDKGLHYNASMRVDGVRGCFTNIKLRMKKLLKSGEEKQTDLTEYTIQLENEIETYKDEIEYLKQQLSMFNKQSKSIKSKKSKMVKVKKVTFEYDTDNDDEPIPETFKTNIFKQQKIEKEELNEIIDLLN